MNLKPNIFIFLKMILLSTFYLGVLFSSTLIVDLEI